MFPCFHIQGKLMSLWKDQVYKYFKIKQARHFKSHTCDLNLSMVCIALLAKDIFLSRSRSHYFNTFKTLINKSVALGSFSFSAYWWNEATLPINTAGNSTVPYSTLHAHPTPSIVVQMTCNEHKSHYVCTILNKCILLAVHLYCNFAQKTSQQEQEQQPCHSFWCTPMKSFCNVLFIT